MPATVSLFQQLASGLPLTPITDDPSEWVEVEESLYQNKRCGSLFRESMTVTPYNVEAIVWVDRVSKTGFVSSSNDEGNLSSFLRFTCPFAPKTFYVEVDVEEKEKDKFNFSNPDPEQFKQPLSTTATSLIAPNRMMVNLLKKRNKVLLILSQIKSLGFKSSKVA